MGPAATRRIFGARKDRPAPAQIVFETDLKIEDNETGPVYGLVTPAANGLRAANQEMRKCAALRPYFPTRSVNIRGRAGQSHDIRQAGALGPPDPEWVTIANMNSTVIADGFISAAQLCRAP